jgi:hypothetical protein
MAALLLTGLLLAVPISIPADLSQATFPDRPGVFAVTDRGMVELKVVGEQRTVEGAIDTFAYAASELDQIPAVASVRSLYVNLMGWLPKDLYLIVGRHRLATPRDEYRRLLGRAYSKGPVLFEVVTEKLEPDALQKEYRQLARKKRAGEDVRAFVVLELASQAGLNRRSYPIQVEIPPGSAAK